MRCPDHCCNGPVPPTLTLEIANVPSEVIWDRYHNCEANCSSLTGTYVLTLRGVNGAESGAGDRICWWRKVVEPWNNMTPATPCNNGSQLVIDAYTLILGNGQLGIAVYLSVGSYSWSTGGYNITAYVENGTTPCKDWTDWIDLAWYDHYDYVYYNPWFCEAVGEATFKIKTP